MAFDRDRLREILGDGVGDDALSAVLKAHSQSVSQDKGSIDRLQQQLDAYAAREAEWEAQRQAGLSEQERLQEALDAAAKAQADFARKSARLDAEQVLVAAGIAADQYAPLLDALVSEDAKASVANARALADLVAERSKAASDAAVAQLMQQTPQPQPGSEAASTTTKEQFDSMTFAEKVAFKAENPDAFAAFAAN